MLGVDSTRPWRRPWAAGDLVGLRHGWVQATGNRECPSFTVSVVLLLGLVVPHSHKLWSTIHSKRTCYFKLQDLASAYARVHIAHIILGLASILIRHPIVCRSKVKKQTTGTRNIVCRGLINRSSSFVVRQAPLFIFHDL